jgi:hypothetical protein
VEEDEVFRGCAGFPAAVGGAFIRLAFADDFAPFGSVLARLLVILLLLFDEDFGTRRLEEPSNALVLIFFVFGGPS